jgi:hypothetical protein
MLNLLIREGAIVDGQGSFSDSIAVPGGRSVARFAPGEWRSCMPRSWRPCSRFWAPASAWDSLVVYSLVSLVGPWCTWW